MSIVDINNTPQGGVLLQHKWYHQSEPAESKYNELLEQSKYKLGTREVDLVYKLNKEK